jgi:hypothetical protein
MQRHVASGLGPVTVPNPLGVNPESHSLLGEFAARIISRMREQNNASSFPQSTYLAPFVPLSVLRPGWTTSVAGDQGYVATIALTRKVPHRADNGAARVQHRSCASLANVERGKSP